VAHPHIVGVHDRGEDDGQLWIAMDYVAGHAAAALLRDQRPAGLPPQGVAQIVTAVAEALDHTQPDRCRAPSGHTDTVRAALRIHSLGRTTLLAVSIEIAVLTLSGKEVRGFHSPH
jgi:serine/threonine protein kinase